MITSLLRSLRVVARADADPTRVLLFEALARRSAAVRVASWITHGPLLRGTVAASLTVATYGFVSALATVAVPPHGRGLWALPLYPNDRRELATVGRWVGAGMVRWGKAGAAAFLSPRAWRSVMDALPCTPRYVRVVHRLCRRHEFLVACRTATALACAMLARASLRRHEIEAVMVGSDYNAEAVGLTWAARACGTPTIFVAHSPAHALSPPLTFTLAVLEGEASLDAYRDKGPVMARVAFKGIDGETRPLATRALARLRPTIGFFLPKEIVRSALEAYVRQVQEQFEPRRILLRWHPNTQGGRAHVRWTKHEVIEACPPDSPLAEDARRCDWVVADLNSAVHLGVLKAGTPSVAVRGLAVFPAERDDQYGLVARRVVAYADHLDKTSVAAAAAFYGGDWPQRIRRFDAAYGRTVDEVSSEIRAAILAAVRRVTPSG